jgi:cell wall-associated NlpC family hydrolase
MKRIVITAISLVLMLAAAPAIATADPAVRPPGNQKFVDAVIARALSQRGVPFAYGGGNANGPSLGHPATPAAPATAQIEQQSATAAQPGLLAGILPAPAPAPAPAQPDVVGFDASGLMVYAFAAAGVKLPRTSGQQYNAGMKVLPAQALPGDLIFYGPDGTQSVALFLGNGQMVEVGDAVTVSPVRTNGMTPYLTRIIA